VTLAEVIAASANVIWATTVRTRFAIAP